VQAAVQGDKGLPQLSKVCKTPGNKYYASVSNAKDRSEITMKTRWSDCLGSWVAVAVDDDVDVLLVSAWHSSDTSGGGGHRGWLLQQGLLGGKEGCKGAEVCRREGWQS
jgi:hypothetical protein